MNSSRPISGRSRGITFACDGTARFATCGQDGEASGPVPEVLHELYVGVGYTETPAAEVEKIRAVLDSRPVVETTAEIARTAGRIDRQLRRSGDRVSPNDIVIGATARRYDEPVVTTNPADFERIPDVTVRVPGR